MTVLGVLQRKVECKHPGVDFPSQGVSSAPMVESLPAGVYPLCQRQKSGYIGGCCLKDFCLPQPIRTCLQSLTYVKLRLLSGEG